MKKLKLLLFALCISLYLAACTEKTNDNNTSSISTYENVSTSSEITEITEITKSDIKDTFLKTADKNVVVADCVVIDDSKYDIIGAVLFTYEFGKSINVAFINSDDSFYTCSFNDKTSFNNEFTLNNNFEYEGNDTVSFLMESNKTGKTIKQSVSFIKDGENQHYKATSETIE